MYTIDPAIAEKIFHDWAGYFMMPLALGMLYLLQQLLSKLFVPEHEGLTAFVPLGTTLGTTPGTTVDGDGRHRPSGQAAAGPVFPAGMLMAGRMAGRKSDADGHGNDKTG
jgi:hypothetical protein